MESAPVSGWNQQVARCRANSRGHNANRRPPLHRLLLPAAATAAALHALGSIPAASGLPRLVLTPRKSGAMALAAVPDSPWEPRCCTLSGGSLTLSQVGSLELCQAKCEVQADCAYVAFSTWTNSTTTLCAVYTGEVTCTGLPLHVNEAAPSPSCDTDAGSAHRNVFAYISPEKDTCKAVIAPRGVAVVTKGPPWLPMMDKFNPEASVSDEDFLYLRAAGINMIRLGAMMPGVMPKPPDANWTYPINHTYVRLLQEFVAKAATYGIYTVLDFHQDILSEHFCGEGLPLWAAAELKEAFPHDFVEGMVGLVHALIPLVKLPGITSLVDKQVREAVRKNLAQMAFPAPLAAPYELATNLAPPYGAYTRLQCSSLPQVIINKYDDYQFTFEAGHAYRTLYNVESRLFRHFRVYWETLAAAFKGNPNILAFELINEPFPGDIWTEPWIMLPFHAARRLLPFYTVLSEAIHAIDPDRLVAFSPETFEEGRMALRRIEKLLETPGGTFCSALQGMFQGNLTPLADSCTYLWDLRELRTRMADEGLNGFEHTAFPHVPLPNKSIFSFHYYHPPQSGSAEYLEQRRHDVEKLHTFGLVTETCCTGYPNETLLGALYWMEHAQVGWTLWEYKNQAIDDPIADPNSTWGAYGARKTGTGPSMFYPDGTPDFQRFQEIAHPSAQFVYGEVLTNEFQYWTGRFKLTFRPNRPCLTRTPWAATILWPSGWWAQGGPGVDPEIQVIPAGAASLWEIPWYEADLPQPPSDMKVPAPGLHAYGVKLSPSWANQDAVTIVLSFPNFSPMPPPLEEVDRGRHHHRWWVGCAWVAFTLVLLAMVGCCCVCLGKITCAPCVIFWHKRITANQAAKAPLDGPLLQESKAEGDSQMGV